MKLPERRQRQQDYKSRIRLDLQAVHHAEERKASLRQLSGKARLLLLGEALVMKHA
jgi:hypothetical protein